VRKVIERLANYIRRKMIKEENYYCVEVGSNKVTVGALAADTWSVSVESPYDLIGFISGEPDGAIIKAKDAAEAAAKFLIRKRYVKEVSYERNKKSAGK